MIRFRKATIEDAKLLFDWRNDPLTRQMSRTTEPVEWTGHVEWLTKRLERQESDLFIFELAGRPVATIRIDGDEVSYTVAPEDRGHGIATEMLKIIREHFGSLKAEIFPHNIASIKAAAAAGMQIVLLPVLQNDNQSVRSIATAESTGPRRAPDTM